MSKPFQLTIPKPCHEDWNNMTPDEKGRFCSSCQKQVVDFTSMNNQQLAAFFKKPSTGSVCGRFNNDQLNQDLQVPQKRIPWLKYFFTIAVPTFFAVTKAKAQGEPIKIIKGDTTTSLVSARKILGRLDVSFGKRNIVGKVIDDKGESISFATISTDAVRTKADGNGNFIIKADFESESIRLKASAAGHTDNTVIISKADLINPQIIMLKQQQLGMSEVIIITAGQVEVDRQPRKPKTITGIITDKSGTPLPYASINVKGKKMGTSADDKGQFKLEVPKSNKTLSVSYVGYETKEIETKNLPENMVIELNEANQTLEGEVVVVGFISRKMKVCTPEKEIPTEPPKETPLFTRIFKDSTFKNFKLYPNPVLQGMPISIQWAKPEDGEFEIQLLDQSGQLINRKTEMAKGKINFMKYSIPSVTPGSYFLVIINRKSGKKLTEKIIIQ